MNEITVGNYRCFREHQTARLAPLTLLVGDNSTGKTSFLAMIRALTDVAIEFKIPDFKEEPFDLGSFEEIAHHRGGRFGHAATFEGGYGVLLRKHFDNPDSIVPYHFEVEFGREGSAPIPIRRRIQYGDIWWEHKFSGDWAHRFFIGSARGSWEIKLPILTPSLASRRERLVISPHWVLGVLFRDVPSWIDATLEPVGDTDSALNTEEIASFKKLRLTDSLLGGRPFASAPVRSRPRRTYDPTRYTADPEGDNIPTYLAGTYFTDKSTWSALKEGIEEFGKSSGLFDEISIRPLGGRESEPFQVQIRKFGSRLVGPKRNLIDVGYGVSQVLPVITQLLRPEAPPLFLLQQPEVHLHPSAQAALGSMFCRVAETGPQLIVETHSDHLIDRVRMDVRDGALRPADVSVLFFERDELDVRIHSLQIDEDGNIAGAPRGYRRFFMEETRRSLGL